MLKIALALGAAALLLGACGGGDEVGPPQIEERERELGAKQHPILLAEFGGGFEGQEADYVKQIGETLAAKAGLEEQCTFTLVNSDVVNAFAVPGCYIYITRGLMAIVNSEAEMASVLAHELGHIIGDHSERQQKRSLFRNLGVLAVGLVTGSQRLTQIAGQAAELFTLRYSRKQEYQSDDFGIRYMREAGYDPFAAADMLDALARQERYVQATRSRDEARSIPEWARTHPLTENRIERARETAAATGTAPDALPENEVRYLTMLDGLLYGDDPQQGFVQGRRFVHPVMRIGFEAPEGFTLTNSPQAILIEGPDGLRGEFGGGSLPRGGLEAYVSALLQQMLGDAQAQAGEAQQTIVNGVRALFVPIVVQTQQGPMELSIAAYAGGGTNAFHFIMISPPAKGSTAAISALFWSFRLLSPADVAALKPRQIRVVKAGPSDTARSLSAKMVSDNSFEHFLMLNGRSAEQPLRAGELVKLVQLAAQ